jgi:hypothetical protein
MSREEFFIHHRRFGAQPLFTCRCGAKGMSIRMLDGFYVIRCDEHDTDLPLIRKRPNVESAAERNSDYKRPPMLRNSA